MSSSMHVPQRITNYNCVKEGKKVTSQLATYELESQGIDYDFL